MVIYITTRGTRCIGYPCEDAPSFRFLHCCITVWLVMLHSFMVSYIYFSVNSISPWSVYSIGWYGCSFFPYFPNAAMPWSACCSETGYIAHCDMSFWSFPCVCFASTFYLILVLYCRDAYTSGEFLNRYFLNVYLQIRNFEWPAFCKTIHRKLAELHIVTN